MSFFLHEKFSQFHKDIVYAIWLISIVPAEKDLGLKKTRYEGKRNPLKT